jgi:hypothetical protein
MKGIGQYFIAIFLILVCLPAKADQRAFGNSPGSGNTFSLAFAAGNTFGGAILFTPTQDICLSTVTMWLNDYTGQNGIIPTAGIYNSRQQGSGNYQMAAEIAALDTPAPNDGSTAAFTFSDASGQTMLDANTAYWLFAYGMWDGTTNYAGAYCYWATGSAPTGDAAYNQADYYVNGGFSGQSAVPPAFAINAVPEPGFAALLGIPMLLALFRTPGWMLCRRSKRVGNLFVAKFLWKVFSWHVSNVNNRSPRLPRQRDASMGNKIAVKRSVSFIAGLLLISALSVKANLPVFGNSPGNGPAFSLSFASGNTWGGAVLFTPTANISLSSVTLWLSGYDGQNGITPSVGIYNSYQLPNNLFEMGSEVVSLSTPAANSGVTGAFTFSDSSATILKARQNYWLFAYGLWNSSAPNFAGAASYWQAGGGTPTGSAIFDQADYFNNGGLSPAPYIPAFSINNSSPGTINPVPEPGTMALLTIPVLLGLGRMMFNRANAKKLAPVKVRRPVKHVRQEREEYYL